MKISPTPAPGSVTRIARGVGLLAGTVLRIMGVRQNAWRMARYAAAAWAAAFVLMVAAASPAYSQMIEVWIEDTGEVRLTEGQRGHHDFRIFARLTRSSVSDTFTPEFDYSYRFSGTAVSREDHWGCAGGEGGWDITASAWSSTSTTHTVSIDSSTGVAALTCRTSEGATGPLLEDDKYEGAETITLTLSNLRCTAECSGATTSITGAAKTIYIDDNDAAPIVSISGDTTVREGASSLAELTVTKMLATGVSESTVDSIVKYSGSGAVEGTDFEFVDSAGMTIASADQMLTFGPTETTKTIYVRALSDLLTEGDESLIVELYDPEDATVSTVSGEDRATLTLEDVPPPVVTIARDQSDQPSNVYAEGGYGTDTTVMFTVTRSGTDLTSESTVKYRSHLTSGTVDEYDFEFVDSGGAAVAEADRELTFAADETTKTIYVKILGDYYVDDNQDWLHVELYDPVGAVLSDTIGERQEAIVIRDDDTPGISIDSPSADEGATGPSPLTFTLSMNAHLTVDVEVAYEVTGTAVNGEDYETFAQTGTLTIPATMRSEMRSQSLPNEYEVEIQMMGDEESEGDETVIITLGIVTCASCETNWTDPFLGTESVGTGTIIDDDLPRFSISSPSVPVPEGDAGDTPATLTFEVTLSRAVSDRAVTVDYSVTGGTASSGADFTPPTGSTLTFLANDTSETIDVRVFGDDIYETNETVVITLMNPSTGTALGTAEGTGTITNDDDPPVLTVSNAEATEGNAGDADTPMLRFVVSKEGETEVDATVDYALSGTATLSGNDADITHTVSSPITIPAADSSFNLDIAVAPDSRIEASETVIVTLANPNQAVFESGATMITGEGTITDDDAQALVFSISNDSVVEGNAGTTTTLDFTVTLGAVPPADVTVDFTVGDGDDTATVADGDYVVPSNRTITFRQGTSTLTQTIQVTVNGDDAVEPEETLTVTLSSPACAACPSGVLPRILPGMGTGTGTIESDDVPLISIDSPAVAEGSSGETPSLTFTVEFAGAAWSQEITVDYTISGTATPGEDYRTFAPGTLTFPAGSSDSQSITVQIIGDRDSSEPDETVVVTLSNVTGGAQLGNAVGTGVIRNDDFALSVSAEAPRIREPDGDSPAELAYTVNLAPPSQSAITVQYSFSGDAVEGVDFTDATDAPDGRLTFEPGEQQKTITVEVNSDVLIEAAETLTVTLSEPTDSYIETGTASTQIVPPRTAPAARITLVSAELHESGGAAQPAVSIELAISQAQSSDITVPWRVSILRRSETDGSITSIFVAGGDATIQAGEPTASAREPVTIPPSRLGGQQLLVELGTPMVAGARSHLFQYQQGILLPQDIQAVSAGTDFVAVGVLPFRSDRQQTALTYVLSGIGRASATSFVNIIWDRAEARRSNADVSYASLGGRTVDPHALASGDAGRAVREVAGLFGVKVVSPDAAPANGGYQSGGYDDYRSWASLPSRDAIAGNSRFALSLAEDRVGGGVAVWGMQNIFNTESKITNEDNPAFTSESQVTSGHLGFDWPIGDRAILGIAAANTRGETDYSFDGLVGLLDEARTEHTSFASWLHLTAPSGFEIWGGGGMGSGTIEMLIDSQLVDEADITVEMAMAGMRTNAGAVDGVAVGARADVFAARITADETGSVSETTGNASRLRFAIETTAGRALEDNSAISTRFELGGRFDGGDAEQGGGADIAGSFLFASQSGLEVSGRGSMLLFHSQEGFKEYSIGFSVGYRSDPIGRGLQLSLDPSWNAASDSGSVDPLLGLSGAGGGFSSSSTALSARLGWGVDVMRGRALATVYGETEDDGDDRRLRLGGEMREMDTAFGRFQLGVYGERETDGPASRDRALMLEGKLGF